MDTPTFGQLVDHKQYTDDELENLNWEKMQKPVTCISYMDIFLQQIQKFGLNKIFLSNIP